MAIAPSSRSATRAPAHLSKHSKVIYRQLVADYALAGEPHALETLRLGLEALDRADEARELLAEHGLTYLDRFGAPRSRPEIAVERDSRLAAVRCFRELSLDSAYVESRLPRTDGSIS